MARILVVDDEQQIVNAFRMTLERAGYEVEEAPDGNAALKLFAQSKVDLVVTDIVMPEKDGIEVVMELRSRSPHVKILAISGGGHVNPFTYLAMAKQLGADVVLVKPVDTETLLKTVALLLDKAPVP
jgi:DNA-binding response OmpR family regulator